MVGIFFNLLLSQTKSSLKRIIDRWFCKKLGQFAIPDTCEKCLGIVNNCVYFVHQTREINQVLPYAGDFKAQEELCNPLKKAVLRKCSFIWNKGPVNILNDRQAQK